MVHYNTYSLCSVSNLLCLIFIFALVYSHLFSYPNIKMIQSFWLDGDWLWIGMRYIHLIHLICKAKIELVPVSQKVVNRTIYDLSYDPLPTRFATISQNFRFPTCGNEDIFVRRYEHRSIYPGRAPVRWIYFSCSGSIWIVKLHWLDKCLLFTFNDQNIALLVHTWFLLSNRQKR